MKIFVCVLVTIAVVCLGAIVEAQERVKVPRIGVLFPGSPATFALRTKAFLQGLGELGYLEGKP